MIDDEYVEYDDEYFDWRQNVIESLGILLWTKIGKEEIGRRYLNKEESVYAAAQMFDRRRSDKPELPKDRIKFLVKRLSEIYEASSPGEWKLNLSDGVDTHKYGRVENIAQDMYDRDSEFVVVVHYHMPELIKILKALADGSS